MFLLELCIFVAIATAVHVIVYGYVTRKRPKSILGRHVVVTGGSKGIGLCISVECALKGADVTIIARDKKILDGALTLLETMRQTTDQKFQAKSLDLTADYNTVSDTLAECEQSFGPIYMLVNCAGMAICGVFEEISVEDAKKLMDINYFGTYYCTRYVLPKMKASGEGIIVVIASQAALFGIYGYGAYAASKFALRGMAETIAMESRHLGVSITLALPADTKTPGFENEEKTKPQETKLISAGGGIAQPDAVARSIVDDALKTNFISIMGIESWFLTLLGGGLLRWGGILQNILHVIALGPLRIFGSILHLHFDSIIKKCAKERSQRSK